MAEAAAEAAAKVAAAAALAVGAPSATGVAAGAGGATEDASMRVNISFAVQYWGAGEGWSERLAGWVAPMLPQLQLAATAAQLSAEVRRLQVAYAHARAYAHAHTHMHTHAHAHAHMAGARQQRLATRAWRRRG